MTSWVCSWNFLGFWFLLAAVFFSFAQPQRDVLYLTLSNLLVVFNLVLYGQLCFLKNKINIWSTLSLSNHLILWEPTRFVSMFDIFLHGF